MKLRVLSAAAVVLLVALVAAHGAPDRRPVLARLGEEYFIRVGNRERDTEPRRWLRRAVQLQLEGNVGAESYGHTMRRKVQAQQSEEELQERDEQQQQQEEELQQQEEQRQEEQEERARRSEEPPISLDLTFHLLREVLEMARAEQLAQQAHSNRKMMEIFGK
ncbi:corticotropin releasing hormone b [Hoplias malabaricus]|uniref:corticotropin releasing hormone b n=1 Tax=Hoplias malabaricus TaxID=27720 RepID=UPI0034633B13